MRVSSVFLFFIFTCAVPRVSQAQATSPGENAVAVGGDVGFLATNYGETSGTVDAYVEYYYTARASVRGLYDWSQMDFEAARERSLRRQHLLLNFVYNWEVGRFRPFVTIGGGAYFLQRREGGQSVGESVSKPGGNVGGGIEYDLRTFAIKTEMNVQILTEEERFPELNGKTLSGFTWTFGVKVPF